MKKQILLIIALLAFCLTAMGNMSVFPTFESCGVYIPFDRDVTCNLSFRKTADSEWTEAYPAVYDPVGKEFRGSIVRLREDTGYDVKAEVIDLEGKKLWEKTASFRTWKSDVKIRRTIPLSKFKSKGAYRIENIRGSENNWIKVVGNNEVIDLSNTKEDAAILISGCNYLILEGVTLIGGAKHGILVDKTCADIRVINCDISGWGRTTDISRENGDMIDISTQKPINWDAGVRIEQALNIVVERCYIHDPRGITNPWAGEILVGKYKGQFYERLHPKGMNGIYVFQAAGGIVIRYNDIIGSQTHRYNDPVETAHNGNPDGGLNRDSDVYGNVMAFGQDDGIELDGGQCNVRLYDNRIEQVFCGISTAPNGKGPSYIFNNVVFNQGDSYGNTGAAIKNGGSVYSPGRQFLFNNTVIGKKNVMAGVGFGKGNVNREIFVATTRNNIFVSEWKPEEGTNKGGSIADKHFSAHNDFDYDMLGNTAVADGKGLVFATEGSEKNGVYGLPSFTSQTDGIFTLSSTDIGIDKGIAIPNFNTEFSGSAPDIGALELGVSSLIPARPLDITADKYSVNLVVGQSVTITFKVGDIEEDSRIVVYKSKDMDWLEADLSTAMITSNSEFTLRLKASKADHRQVGMLIVRLENGLSVPVSVSSL